MPISFLLENLNDARRPGAMVDPEFVKNPNSEEAWLVFVLSVIQKCTQQRVVLLRADLYSNASRLLPHLHIPENILPECLSVISSASAEKNRG